MKSNDLLFAVTCLWLAGCSSALVSHEYPGTPEVTDASYRAGEGTEGVVLVSVGGSRVWGCGGYENAELRSLGFDLQPSSKQAGGPPDLVINAFPDGASDYAFLLPPGTYGLSYASIKVARSMSDVGYVNVDRSALMSAGRSAAGSFTVEAGQAVYIGHFGLDCAHAPMPWRYYLESRADFDAYVQQARAAHPYIEFGSVTYRLFETRDYGQPFSLRE